jgi:hypothetical protein
VHEKVGEGGSQVMRCVGLVGLILIIISWGAACSFQESDDNAVVPTLIDLTQFPTDLFLTENAPPTGFGQIGVAPIDARLSAQLGWSYSVSGRFEGTFADTGQPATGSFEARLQGNELGQRYWLILTVEGDALLPENSPSPLQLEAIRIGPSFYYFVDVNENCWENRPEDAAFVDLAAGQLIGGVEHAVPTGHQDTIDGVQSWQYTFNVGDVQVPTVSAPGALDHYAIVEGDLWVAPVYNAAMRFELTLAVNQTRILWTERAVSGMFYLRYDLLEIFEQDIDLPNISPPHGCETLG